MGFIYEFGDKISMTTYHDINAAGDVTRWLRDEATGLVTNKVYADGKGPRYIYTPDGKLATRTWARGIVTTYSYDTNGALTNTVYSDGTPSILFAYNRAGQQIEAHDAAGVTTFLYDDFGAVTNETVLGVAGTNVIERFYDSLGRALGYSLNGVRQSTLAYDPETSRLATMLANGSEVPFKWNYLNGSDLKFSLDYPNGMTVSWAYDANNQLLQVCNATLTNVISQYDYTYDVAGRRMGVSKSGCAFAQNDSVDYGYNEKSELTNAVAMVDSNYSYAYDFDDIGNRETSSERGTNSLYCANNLNQYTTVDDFTPQFDDDGNQTLIKTATGIWQVQYNGENRPVFWSNGATNIVMSYDRMGRRVTKNKQRFVYDGYLQIANFELQTSNNKLQTFVWDPTEPVTTRPLAWTHGNSVAYYTHDGNKNVSEVMASDGAIAAHYEYAPFGFVTVQRGESVMTNPWRFSCEYAENETETVYYNYRHYNPNEGRWVYRDLFENLVLAARLHPWRSSQENLYCAVNNRTSFAVDALGLTDVVSDQEFPSARQVGNKWWLYVDDGQNGKVGLIRYTRDRLRDEMRSAAIQLCIYQRDDWIPTRAYEGGFDTGFFEGENKQHSYYYIEGESQIWADNEVNYIGIGMYEAWLGSPKWLGSVTIVSWKILRWWTLPTDGTFYWYSYGYDNFNSYYSQLDKCTCKPKDGSSWYYDGSTYSAKRP